MYLFCYVRYVPLCSSLRVVFLSVPVRWLHQVRAKLGDYPRHGDMVRICGYRACGADADRSTIQSKCVCSPPLTPLCSFESVAEQQRRLSLAQSREERFFVRDSHRRGRPRGRRTKSTTRELCSVICGTAFVCRGPGVPERSYRRLYRTLP